MKKQMKKQKLNGTKADVSGALPLLGWLETTMKGRYLMNQIKFPIANLFKSHPEKIPTELVVEIIQAVRGNDR